VDECKPLIRGGAPRGGGGGEAAKSAAGLDPRFGDGSTPADLPKPVAGSADLSADVRAWRSSDMVGRGRLTLSNPR